MTTSKGEIHTRKGSPLPTALVFPNSHRVGGANLGFQAVYRFLKSDPRFTVERFFVSPRSRSHPDEVPAPLSLDSQRSLSSFPVIAFSVPFENDYPSVAAALESCGVPPLAQDRGANDPIVVAGGIAVSLNPEPLAPFVDLVWIGEFDEAKDGGQEGVFSALARLLREGGQRSVPAKAELINEFRSLESVYVPSGYQVTMSEDGVISEVAPRPGFPARVKARKLSPYEGETPHSVVFSHDAEFGDALLVEVNRGCARGCRFCAGGWMHRPVRYRPYSSFAGIIDQAIRDGRTVGLVGSDLAGHPDLEEILRSVVAQGGKFSLSSIRPEGLTPTVIELLKTTGHRTATLAPETASPRLKETIGKRIPSETFLELTENLVRSGVPNVRFYFMIGLPTEEDGDVESIVEFAAQAGDVFLNASRKVGRIGRIGIQVNPFVPKPWTPFQWAASTAPDVLEKRAAIIRQGLKRRPNMTLRIESLREAQFQALLSRGVRGRPSLLPNKTSFGRILRGDRDRYDALLKALVYRVREKDELFPWDVVDHGVTREVLWKAFMQSQGRPPLS